jgi:predicted dehydrogenase
MVTELDQCRAIVEAERTYRRRVAMAFNYRYSPKLEKIWSLLRTSDLGKVTSVDFSWYLDVFHGADYFRRWHRLRNQGGSLWLHKATHHFDLMNWWLGADPVEVQAVSSLRRYGRNGAFRHSHCRTCPHKASCEFYFDMTTSPRLMALYASAESIDGYHRDGCVFREDCDTYDTMSAIIRYSTGTVMTYSLNAFMPFEGRPRSTARRAAWKSATSSAGVRSRQSPRSPDQGFASAACCRCRRSRAATAAVTTGSAT